MFAYHKSMPSTHLKSRRLPKLTRNCPLSCFRGMLEGTRCIGALESVTASDMIPSHDLFCPSDLMLHCFPVLMFFISFPNFQWTSPTLSSVNVVLCIYAARDYRMTWCAKWLTVVRRQRHAVCSLPSSICCTLLTCIDQCMRSRNKFLIGSFVKL